MKTIIITSCLLTLMFQGCTHKYTVPSDSTSLTQLQHKTQNKEARVTLASGQYYLNVNLTRLTPDSTSWSLPSGELMSVPTSEIADIRFISRTKGAFQGFGIGLGARLRSH